MRLAAAPFTPPPAPADAENLLVGAPPAPPCMLLEGKGLVPAVLALALVLLLAFLPRAVVPLLLLLLSAGGAVTAAV